MFTSFLEERFLHSTLQGYCIYNDNSLTDLPRDHGLMALYSQVDEQYQYALFKSTINHLHNQPSVSRSHRMNIPMEKMNSFKKF